MTDISSDVAFTPTVKAIQERKGSRGRYARMEEKGGWTDFITPDLARYLTERDTIFLATATADGQPYIQHRGGPPGFIKVLDAHTLAFADFKGNRQYITQGNLQDNDKAYIFAMDFANRRRIKIWGRARIVEDDPNLLAQLTDPAYGEGQPEQALVFTVAAWDANCPQHITPRFTQEEIRMAVAPMMNRIKQLEDQLASAGLTPEPPSQEG